MDVRDEPEPSTPRRVKVSPLGEWRDNTGVYTGVNKFGSPLNWPPPSPGGGFTSPRNFGFTPIHGFGSAAIGDGRLSMGQFEFGADGELVLYSAGGRAIPSSVDRTAAHASVKDTLDGSKNRFGLDDKFEVAKQSVVMEGNGRPGLVHLDITPLSLGIGGEVGYPQRDNHSGRHGAHAVPRLSSGGIVVGTDAIKQDVARQLALANAVNFAPFGDKLTDGGRCKNKSVAFDERAGVNLLDDLQKSVKAPLSPLELELSMDGFRATPQNIAAQTHIAPMPMMAPLLTTDEDDLCATPEMRTRKIKFLYGELQGKQELLSYLQSQICLADQHIAKLIRTNVGLWACSAHIASCIGLALEEESRSALTMMDMPGVSGAAAAENNENENGTRENLTADNVNERGTKRRRSSLGVASLTQCLNAKANAKAARIARKAAKATEDVAIKRAPGLPSSIKVDGKQLLELEEIFAKPKAGEFATGEMINHFPSPNVLKNTGMCPVENHSSPIDSALPLSAVVPLSSVPLSSVVPLGNSNALQEERDDMDIGAKVMANSQIAPLPVVLSKENSFSFN